MSDLVSKTKRFEEVNLKNAQWVSAGGKYPSWITRLEFSAKDVKRASVTTACLGLFEGFINGRPMTEDLFVPIYTDFHKRAPLPFGKVMLDEERHHRLYCPVYDITNLLNDGQNTISYILGPGWYERPHDPYHFGNIKFCFVIEVEHTDGRIEYITSNTDMKQNKSFIIMSDIINGEYMDFNGYDDDFMYAGFDDSSWSKVIAEQTPQTDFYRQNCPADRVMGKITPKLISEKDGVRIYEVGFMMTGYPLIYTTDKKTQINIRYGEKITEDGKLSEDNVYLQHTNIKTDGKRRCVHSEFTWLGFKYFEVTGECEIGDCLVIYTDIKKTSNFSCSNETLQWLYDAYVRTQLENYHCGIPSDCPHIERKGYTGDGQLTCRAAMMYLDAKEFYQKWIYDISDCQDKKSGHVWYAAPVADVGGGPGGWSSAIVFVPYQYYLRYGDSDILRELYPQMLRYFDYMDTHSENELVISDIEGAWCLGEWCVPEQIILDDKDGLKLPPPFINTFFYIKALKTVLKIADILDIDDKERIKSKIEKKSKAICDAYFDKDTGDFCSNRQGANAFAVEIGLGDERTMANVIRHYAKLKHLDTGIFGTELVPRLLFERGYADLAVDLLTSTDTVSFYNQMKLGATTILENWNGVRSQCHPMFGAVSSCLAEYVLGIRQREGSTAYSSVVIEPMCMDKIKKASGFITTDYGIISVDYDEEYLRVQLPMNVKAEVKAGNRKPDILYI